MWKSRLIVALSVGLLLTLTGCGTTGFGYKEDPKQSLRGTKVVLVAPQIMLYEIGVGQQRSRRADLEDGARKAAEAGARLLAKNSGWFQVVAMPQLSDDEKYEFDQRMTMLYANQTEYAKAKELKGSVLAELEDPQRFNSTVGKSPVLQKVADITGATYGMLLAGQDSFTTTAAKVVSIASQVASLGNSPLALTGIGNLSVSVVNLRTGRVIWMASDTSSRDLTDAENQKAVFERLLKRSPLGD